VIWYYSDFGNYPLDPDAQAMIANADQNGTDFIPHGGEVLAILVCSVEGVQRTLLEYTLPILSSIGHLVWYDSDRDGIQDQREQGIADVTVQLYSDTELLIKSTTTDIKGYYSFSNLTSGKYYLQFVLPYDYRFSPQNIGNNSNIDSDANTTTGKTTLFNVIANQSNYYWDTGMYKPSSGGKIGSPNHPPTADATAGEPYRKFVREEIFFDGSRSYDRDGRIVKWFWNFGDGTNDTGKNVTHLYNNPGRYTVVLTVTDDDGATDSYTTTAEFMMGNNPPSKPIITSPIIENKDVSYIFTAVSTDLDKDTLKYIFNWGDGSQNTSPFFESGHCIQTMHQWNTKGVYTVQIYAQDQHNTTSERYEMVVSIDMRYIADLGYLTEKNVNGTYDVFYSNATGKETNVEKIGNGAYLIDSDGDGTWNIIFYSNSGEIRVYQGIPVYEYLVIALLLIIPLIMFFIFIIFRKKRGGLNKKTTDTLQQTTESTGPKDVSITNTEETTKSIE
jgi:PKD repeat protein